MSRLADLTSHAVQHRIDWMLGDGFTPEQVRATTRRIFAHHPIEDIDARIAAAVAVEVRCDEYTANDALADAAEDRHYAELHEFDDPDLARGDECGCEDCDEGDE